MRLIDADALIYQMLPDAPRGATFLTPKSVADAPTIDAVPVVRCKDCKYGELDDPDFPFQYLCNYVGCVWNNADHFCSYGERKDGEG